MNSARQLSWFDKLVYFFNLLAIVVLLCTYTAPFINPETLWIPAVLALGYPYILLVNLFFTLYWLLRKKWKQFFYMLIVLLIGYNMFSKTVALNLNTSVPKSATEGKIQMLKVMSYNVRNFDLYNWKENIPARDRMLNLIRAENPDIICFQEFYTEDKGELHNIKLLVNELGYKYYHFEKTLSLRGKDHWGEAIFSKYPLSNPDKIVFSNSTGNIVAYADVEVNGKLIRIFNAHLQSFKLADKEVKYISELSGNLNDNPLKQTALQKAKDIVVKLGGGFQKRSTQARVLAEHIQKSPHPVVVCGDFNDVPASYTYRTISKNLQDAFLKSDFGMGKTYNALTPNLRIDYILHDPTMVSHGFSILKKDYSDHYAIVCTLELPPK
ncbi:MAG: endonuclease/exonuclease/phosphatase family protein [Sphingobacteriales bacterium]|nr:MAG: endonuclease/exonuclease/phosphatase family protein [Sphingobacteriales bacterium]